MAAGHDDAELPGPAGTVAAGPGDTGAASAPAGEDLTRLAGLHGVATSYSPAPDRTVAVPASAVAAALTALGVDAGTPDAVNAALAERERELRERLLPPTVVQWAGAEPPAALAALPPGTRLDVLTEDGQQREGTAGLPLGVHRLTAHAPDGRTGRAHLVVAPDRLPTPP